MFVEPIVTELLTSALFGMLVRPAPEPAKPVDVRIPVEGTKVSLVLVVLCAWLLEFAETQVG
jgi:hypothetical protein